MSKVIDPNSFVPDKDITLYAVWYDNVKLTFMAMGGDFGFGDDRTDYETYIRKDTKFSPYLYG